MRGCSGQKTGEICPDCRASGMLVRNVINNNTIIKHSFFWEDGHEIYLAHDAQS